jgi:hypothetical protein
MHGTHQQHATLKAAAAYGLKAACVHRVQVVRCHRATISELSLAMATALLTVDKRQLIRCPAKATLTVLAASTAAPVPTSRATTSLRPMLAAV